jgi:hypothetical protein
VLFVISILLLLSRNHCGMGRCSFICKSKLVLAERGGFCPSILRNSQW